MAERKKYAKRQPLRREKHRESLKIAGSEEK
jgi:hypothetical protein